MPVDWINEDGTFVPGFEKNFPEEARDYVKGFKSAADLAKAGLEARTKFRTRVELPTDPDAKKTFVQEHFKDVVDAEIAARKEAEETQSKAEKEKAESEKAKADTERLERSQAKAKEILGGEASATNLELCRRAFRGDFCPQWIKEGVAKAAGVELDKLTDDQIKDVVAQDPAVVETLLKIGSLTRDGRMPTGDGGGAKEIEEITPAYPHNPEYYKGRPDDDPEKVHFIRRGAKYHNGEYLGGFNTPMPS